LQRKASGSIKTLNSSIQTDISYFISKRPLVESPAAETYSSQEIENLSQILKVEEPSLSSNIANSVLEVDISSHPKEIITGSSQQKETSSSSSLNSSPTKPTEGVLYTHTNLPILEDILHDLSSKGEESLALLLSQFYKASYFSPIPENSVQGEVRQPFYFNSVIPSPPPSPTNSSSVSTPKTAMAAP
jgi:hypothetical protein